MTLAEVLEHVTPTTRDHAATELRLAHATRTFFAWSTKRRQNIPTPMCWGNVWTVNLPAYELTEDRGFIMRDFTGADAAEAFINAASALSVEDPTL